MAVKLTPRRISADEYHKMAEVGILARDERTELINGEILRMSPIGGRHVEVVAKLTHLLVAASGNEWRVNVQSPLTLTPDREPQPDLAVVRARSYGPELPRAEDILLVIEVADTSLNYDQEVKLPLYAAAEIAEAWIVDLNGSTLKCHSEPTNGMYTATRTAGPGMRIASTVLPGFAIEVDAILVP